MTNGTYYRYDRDYEGYFLQRLRVIRHTPCGVVVDNWGEEKFVLNGCDGKRFAYPTKEAAWESFLRRKRRQLRILAAQHDAVKMLIEMAEKGGMTDGYYHGDTHESGIGDFDLGL